MAATAPTGFALAARGVVAFDGIDGLAAGATVVAGLAGAVDGRVVGSATTLGGVAGVFVRLRKRASNPGERAAADAAEGLGFTAATALAIGVPPTVAKVLLYDLARVSRSAKPTLPSPSKSPSASERLGLP